MLSEHTEDLGLPLRRERRYTLCILKSKVEVSPVFDHETFSSIAFADARMQSLVFL